MQNSVIRAERKFLIIETKPDAQKKKAGPKRAYA